MLDLTKMSAGRNGVHKAPPHIFIGLCSHDHRVHARFMMSLIGIIASGRFKTTVSNVSSGGIHKARNNLAWEFLTRSDAEYYLSLDTDISDFQPDMISRLMSHNVDIVGAPYCHKKPEIEWSARAIPGVGPDPQTGLQELAAHGTGCLLIKRRVMETLRDQCEKSESPMRWAIEDWTEGRGQKKWDIFWEGIVIDPEFGYDKRTPLTEDFGFCYWARKAGFKIYTDTTFYLKHWDGGRGYPEKEPPSHPPQPSAPITVNERFTI